MFVLTLKTTLIKGETMVYKMNETVYKDLQRAKMTHSDIIEYANTVLCNNGEIFGIETDRDGNTFVARRESIRRISNVIIVADLIDRTKYYHHNN